MRSPACAASFREMHFAKGAMLFARGEAGTQLHLIAEGLVRLAIANEEGRELSFRVAARGDLFGEIAALDGSPRSADATALTPVTTYSLERHAFRTLWSTHSAIAAAVIAFLCRRQRETTSQLEAIVLHPLNVRLARFLLLALGDRRAPPGKRVPLELGFSRASWRRCSVRAARRSTSLSANWKAPGPLCGRSIGCSAIR